MSSLDAFWTEQANTLLHWHKPWSSLRDGDFSRMPVRWYLGGELNACYNCVDRHLPKYRDRVAIYWQGDDPDKRQQITYGQLQREICRFANVLKLLQVKAGDRVCLYLPMIPEAIYAMLACARIGAIHTVVFAGFSTTALANRINDANCQILITADESIRGGKAIPLKRNANEAVKSCPGLQHLLLIENTGATVAPLSIDRSYSSLAATVNDYCEPHWQEANAPLFILYTSGSTGKPKGILHGTGGYLTYVAYSFQTVFDYQEKDIFWCTADIGWITGHSYLVYGPLSQGATLVMAEGTPLYPTPARFWQIIDDYQVSIFYTAPTLIRMLMREDERFVQQTSRQSLRLLGSVGEPINPESWQWYYNVVGNGHCQIVDTWWQTETGGIILSPIPPVQNAKPGAACKTLSGVSVGIVDEKNQLLTGEAEGALVITAPWPGMLQGVYGDSERLQQTYFADVPGAFYTGDVARRDADGDYWIEGRLDDVMNVAGHRIGSAEVESALVAHHAIAEAAVIGIADATKGQALVAFVTPKQGVAENEALFDALKQQVRTAIGAFASPKYIVFTSRLPKTRSGKIMRRLLRKIASGDTDLGDVSTLAEPEVIDDIIKSWRPLTHSLDSEPPRD